MSDVDADGRSEASADQPYCIPFETCSHADVATVGGKCASLGELIAAGAPVPSGFAVTTAFYRAYLAHNDLDTTIHRALADLDPDDSESVEAVGKELREKITGGSFSDPLETALSEAWVDLKDRASTKHLRVAVRSSATAEDTADASFAGQYDTYLNVIDADGLRQRIRDCMASLFTDRVIAYRERNGMAHDDIDISVGVQQLVEARSAGVMFTLNPANGDRSKVLIESAWGLGEAVVEGDVTPDQYLVDKPILEIVEKQITSKEVMTTLVEEGIEHRSVDLDRRDEASISAEEAIELTEIGKQIERAFGTPQDIEWAISEDPEGEIYLLQSRPETSWVNE